MFVPRVHQGLHVRVPRRAITFAIALLAIVTVVVAWAALDARPTSREHLGVPASPLPVGTLGSVALLVPEGPVDHLFVQRAASDATRSFITDFPSTFTLHAHGAASPMGDRVAVLWVDGQPGSARLTIVDLRSGGRVETPGTYSYLSTLSWSRDGLRVAALAAARPDASGRFRATVVEIDAASGVARPVAEFDSVLAAAPVGYSADSTRLLIVTIDQSGSAVWSAGDGKLQNVAQLSAGRTQDWRLSPDAARLAFTQVYGAGATRPCLVACSQSSRAISSEPPASATSLGRPGARVSKPRCSVGRAAMSNSPPVRTVSTSFQRRGRPTALGWWQTSTAVTNPPAGRSNTSQPRDASS